MNIAYKAFSALLTYPSPDLVAALPEIEAIIAGERKLAPAHGQALAALCEELASEDLLDLQERYVALFDRGRRTALDLFEHVHGDSRDRGQAMVELKAVYARAGYVFAGRELPDYLPAMLEFLAARPDAEAKDMLGDCAHILRAIGEALVANGSRYGAVFAALLAMVGEPGLSAQPPKAAAREKSIDEEWIEEPVTFGPAAATGCHSAPPREAVVQFMPRRA
jgi:nitrate reductase delta subunit